MIILNGRAGSKGRMAHSCTYFLCFYVSMVTFRVEILLQTETQGERNERCAKLQNKSELAPVVKKPTMVYCWLWRE